MATPKGLELRRQLPGPGAFSRTVEAMSRPGVWSGLGPWRCRLACRTSAFLWSGGDSTAARRWTRVGTWCTAFRYAHGWTDRSRNLARSLVRIVVFPEPEDLPTGGYQPCICIAVPRDVRRQLPSPPRGVHLGVGCVDRAPMPEAAVDEHRDTRRDEREVGAAAGARKRPIHPIAKPEAMHCGPECQLAGCVPPGGGLHASPNTWRRGCRARGQRAMPRHFCS